MLSAIPRRQWRWDLILLAATFLTSLVCYAQGDRGLITGVVRDASAAVVPGASLSATNASTGVAVRTRTNPYGVYTIGQLLPGTYTVAVDHPGFKQFRQTGVIVRVGDQISLDIALETGSINESVVVEAQASLLESASSSLGTVIDNRRITDLPLMHGNPMMLQFLTPGVTFNGNPSFTRPFDGVSTSSTVNGSQQGSLDFKLDGIEDSAFKTAISYQPSVEFVQEYRVQTSAYDASEGHAAGGFVNVAVKSGTNEFHGSAYLYLQNRALNANQFFNNLNGQKKPNIVFNRPGVNAGGPLIKNRTFWFFGYERIMDNLPSPRTVTVPLPAQKTGDFSQLLALGPSYKIYDPATTAPVAGGRYTRLPFAGNLIPSNRISSIGKQVATFYPDPNQTGSADGGSNYYFGSGFEPDRFFSIVGRVDHSLSEKHRIFGRVSVTRRTDGPYRDYFPQVSGVSYFTKHRGGVLDYVYIVNPQTVLNLRYGYTRYTLVHTVTTAGFDIATLGLSEQLRNAISPARWKLPDFEPSGYTGFNSEVPDGRFYNTHSGVASLSRTQGTHLLRAGVEYRAYQYNNYNFGQPTGRYSFGGYLNGPVDNSPSAPRGPGMAGLLLGLPSSGAIDNNDSFAGTNSYFAPYIQDDWKFTRKLTVNLGLRYEFEGAPVERYNRSVLGFDFNAPSPLASQAVAAYAAKPIDELPPNQFKVNGGLTYAGAGGLARNFWQTPKKNFMPRIGLAYLLTPNTVVRAGYGVFFDFLGTAAGWSPIQSGYNEQTPLVASEDNGVTFAASLANPFPGGLLPPQGNRNGLSTFLGRSVSFWNQTPRTPYNQRWSFGVQRQFAGQWLFDLSYVGSRGTALQTSRQLNGLPLQYLSKQLVRDQATINSLSRSVANPFAGLIPGTNLNNATVSASQLLVAYPQFTGVSEVTNEGYSWYHSLQTKVEKRFSRGFTLMGVWTWGKNMEAVEFLNAMDPRPSETISANDRQHRLVINGIYELPFGKGKRYGAGLTGPAAKVVQGWEITAIYQVQSGQPLGFGNFIYYNGDMNVALPSDQRTWQVWFNTAGFERSSSKQLSSNVRYQPLRFSGVRSDRLNYLDCSVIKKTKITEKISADFRSEFINALNHPVFNAPDTNPASSTFGRATSAVALQRTIQFGLVFRF